MVAAPDVKGRRADLPGPVPVAAASASATDTDTVPAATRRELKMASLQLFTQRVPEVGFAESFAERAEAAGWDGLSLTDSQNLVGDPFIAMALGAKVTERLLFMTGVSNIATRHPAALATAAATVQEVSGGRAILGLGRGDTALFHLGRKPMVLAEFCPRVEMLQTYLAGGTVDI